MMLKSMRLKNLFNGDEQLAQAMVEMSNSVREMAQTNQQSNQMMAEAITGMGMPNTKDRKGYGEVAQEDATDDLPPA